MVKPKLSIPTLKIPSIKTPSFKTPKISFKIPSFSSLKPSFKSPLKPAPSSKVKVYFDDLNVNVKDKVQLEAALRKSSKVKRVLKAATNKKILIGGAVAGGTIAYLTQKSMDYIQKNTGCFLHTSDAWCKVEHLSCCNPGLFEGVEFCTNLTAPDSSACDGYDEAKEESCCRQCDCESQKCGPEEYLECRRPTVNEALTKVLNNLGPGLLEDVLGSFSKWWIVRYVAIAFIVLIIVIIGFRILF